MSRKDLRARLSKTKVSPYWYIFYTEENKTKRRSTGTTDRGSAESQLAQFIMQEGADSRNKAIDARQVLIADALAYYLKYHAIKLPSVNVQLGAVERFMEFFGEMTVGAITHISIEKYIEWRRQKPGRCGNKSIGDGTINRDLSVLIAALRYYKKKGLLDKTPFIEKLPEPDPKDLWLERRDIEAILELTWDRIDHNIGIIDLNDPNRTRTKKRRAIIPIAEEFAEILHKARKEAVTDYVIEFRGRNVGDVKKPLCAPVRKQEMHKGNWP